MNNQDRSTNLFRIAFLFRWSLIFFILIAAVITACSKMDDTYRDFWSDGEKVYPASPDSVKIYPGRERLQLTWLILGDPTVSKAKIFWNNKKDSMDMSIQRKEKSIDTIKVILTDMAEGSYSFSIYAYDDKGNRSIPADAVGKVYGDEYINSLLIRLVTSASFNNDSLKIAWGDPADETSIGSELVYTDLSGITRHLQVAPDADSTYVLDYDFSTERTFEYRTLYLPDSLAIDTFYTDYSTIKVKGPRIDLAKTGWTATASSYDERSGTARAPGSTIDNNSSTIWVNQISTPTYYPHWLMVDMGSVKEDIGGLSILVQNRNETPKTIEIAVSEDNIDWTVIGRFTVKNITSLQYIDFSEAHDLRYFKLTAIEPSGSTNNVVIAEIGAFTR